MNDGPISLPQHLDRPRKRPLQASFHVLTDGSEYTGHGCLFLSIRPTPNSIIKYALSGVCEQVSRLAADQKYPLHQTRAVFCPSHTTLDGLASLLLTLQQAGSPELTVCGGIHTCSTVEGVVETVLHRQTTHPRVLTCEIDVQSKEWFQIYQDEYLIVYAKAVNECGDVLLVYTLLESESISFAILPPCCGDTSLLSPLPDVCGSDPLDLILILNGSSLQTPTTRVTRRVLQTAPRNDTLDNGLLIRAQHHSQLRNDQCSFLYPFKDTTSEPAAENNCKEDAIVVTTCATWQLGDDTIDCDTYKQEIWERCKQNDNNDAIATQPTLCRQDFYGNDTTTLDENEIDLDDDLDDETPSDNDTDDVPPTSHLLVLGTGCASPSPLRGSSGYALFVPSDSSSRLKLAMVIDCGEGFVTALRRHLPPGMNLEEQLCNISIIWISHAHLDHYGGLPCLLREMQRARDSNDEAPKRQRLSPPLVIAPLKVLRYLNVLLANNTEKVQDLYEGMTHQDWARQASRRLQLLPFYSLTSVAVDHCPNAHGLLLEWHETTTNGRILFCYSGDCRPSLNFIHHALESRRQQGPPPLTLLLHEATFVNDDVELARTKRHSTVSEALQVASSIQPSATLLTHFSSRNCMSEVEQDKSSAHDDKHSRGINHGFCYDGLWLPLTRRALSNVQRLKS